MDGDPITQTNGVFFLHSDHLGSTSLTTDNNGNVVARQLYDAWGNVRSGGVGSMPTDIGYTGQRLDTSTGLMYYRARYYASSLGRFASADTIVPDAKDPQAWNHYSYTRNDPINRIDPSGHMDQNENDGGVVLDTYIKNKYNYSQRTDPAKKLIEDYIMAVKGMNQSLASYKYAYRSHSQDVNRVLAAQDAAWRDIEATSVMQQYMFQGFVDPNNDVCEPCEYGVGAGPKAAVAGDDYGSAGIGDVSESQMANWQSKADGKTLPLYRKASYREAQSRGLLHGLNDQNNSSWTIYINDYDSRAYAYPTQGYDGKAPNYSLPPNYMQGVIDVEIFFGLLFDKEWGY